MLPLVGTVVAPAVMGHHNPRAGEAAERINVMSIIKSKAVSAI